MKNYKFLKFNCIYFSSGLETCFIFQEKPGEIQPANPEGETDLAKLKKEVEELPMSDKGIALSAAINAVKAKLLTPQQMLGKKESNLEVVENENKVYISPEKEFLRAVDFIKSHASDFGFNEHLQTQDVEYIVELKIKTPKFKDPQAVIVALNENYKVIGMAD